MSAAKKIDVYLEIGQKRTFAGALAWPGWCRSGWDEESALQALLDYGTRYASVLSRSQLGFQAPESTSAFVVVEHLKGNATTDFGAPGIPPEADAEAVSAKEIARFEKILRACLRAFEAKVESAAGKTLQTGPRGGGRQVENIIGHVLDSNEGYLGSVGWKFKRDHHAGVGQQMDQTIQALLEALKASANGEIPAKGPRGGTRWTARYFVRRVAWHILDHAWEIEDRLIVE